MTRNNTKKKKNKPSFYIVRKMVGNIWFFPSILALLLVALTATSVSGSSIGVYDALLQEKNDNLISGTLRTTRSDEWVVNTPLTFSQVNNNFPLINHDIGQGQDMALVADVPYKEWSVLFKPQNLIFFVLPIAQAFAFKWWFLSFILMLSTYLFFVLTTSRKLVAALLAIFIAFNPFIQWWYQSITILPIAYTFLMLITAMQLVKTGSRRLCILYSCLLTYLIVCFTLVMYPPFQISCALAGLFVFGAWYFAKYPWKYIFTSKIYIYLGTSLIASSLIIAGFILNHYETIKMVLNTAYPGHRTVSSGGSSLSGLLYWPFSYLQINDQSMKIFGQNPSADSRFLLFGILSMPYLLYILFIKHKKAKSTPFLRLSRYLLAACTLLLVILMSRMHIPFGDFFFKMLGLSSVPHQRLFIAIGIVNLIVMALAVCSLGFPKRRILATKSWIIFAGFSLLILSTSLLHVHSTYQLLNVGRKEFVVIALVSAGIVALLVHPWHKLRIVGLGLAVVFALISSLQINPLYKGTGTLLNGNLANEISRLEKQDNRSWIVEDYFPIENLPLAVGAESAGGVYTYPQLAIWKKYFPNDELIYNRYAHVNFIIDEKHQDPSIELKQTDYFSVKVSSCSEILNDLSVGYIISQEKNDKYSCFSPIITSPSDSPFVIYKRDK